jgi:hypothetical protein
MTISRREARALEAYSVDLVTAVLDSFAARVREEARHPDNSRQTQAALLAVARSAETTAEGARKELEGRRHPPLDAIRINIKNETETEHG